MKAYSMFVSAKPSFIRGMAKSIDIFGLLSKRRKLESSNKEDANATASDWKAVGEDLHSVLGQSYGR